MAVRFQCKCGKKLKASDEKIGKKVLCSGCGNTIRVPDVDEQPAAKKKKRRNIEPEPAPVAISASAMAGNLLKKTAVDSEDRANSDYDEPQKQESEVDVAGTIQYYLKSTLPGAGAVVIVVIAAYLLSSFIIRGAPPRPPLAEVTGKVLLDGQPLARAHVLFLPVQKEDAEIKPAVSTGLTNAQGEFRLLYVKDVWGAAVGQHRVEITARDTKGRVLVPPKFNRDSTLEFTVPSGGTDEAVFPLNTQGIPQTTPPSQ